MSRIQNQVAKWVGALALLFCSFSYSNAQPPTINIGSGITPPTGTITNHTMGDDGYVHVPLQFGFPFFGKVFTNSFMFDNGVVSFFDPTANIGCNPQVGFCGGNSWHSQPLSGLGGSQFSYMIAPYWTDIRPVPGTTYTTQGDSTQMTYSWNNIGEYYNPSRLSSFSLQIRPSGFIGVDYTKVDLTSSNLSIGVIGDPSKGEVAQHYWANAGTQIGLNSIQNWNIGSTGTDLCVINPLSSPTCPGYQQAYFNYQCSINALYDPACPGYQQAYFNQQCSLNPLYNPSCPGYEQAFLNQQCSINPLYSVNCADYQTALTQCTASPLYASYCPNYQTATLQCAANPLYASYCPGYATALQTCTTNPLSNNLCSGYTAANLACTNNQLTYTYCPSYTTTLASCGSNPQSNTLCPGYNPTASNNSNQTGNIASVSEPSTTIKSDGTISTEVSKTGDSNVDKAITATTTTTTPTSPAAAVNLSSPQQSTQQAVQNVNTQTNTKTETKTEAKTASSSSEQKQSPKTESKSDDKQKSTEIKQAAQEKAKEEMKKAETASTFEGQVAVQTNVIGAMSFVPGFSAYAQIIVPDTLAKDLQKQYGKDVVDNRRLGRGLIGPSDKMHQEMVNQQHR